MGYVVPFKESVNFVKLDNEIFNVIDVVVQLSIGSHTTTHLSVDLIKYPEYLNKITDIFEMSKKFEMISNRFIAPGSYIKSIDVDFDKKMNISVKSDVFNNVDTQQRRDEMLDELLNNETYTDKNNIK
jgi:hypothetical protein